MRNRVFAVVATGIFSVAIIFAESPVVTRCAGDIGAMHGVWLSPQSFLPVYADWELTAYLASVKRPGIGVPVLPVFSPEPLYFRSAHVVFVSTGFLRKAASEQEIAEAIATAPLAVVSRALPACATIGPSVSGGFAGMQRRLTEQLAGYDDVTTRRLRRRDSETR